MTFFWLMNLEWGSRTYSLGTCGVAYCPSCHTETPFDLFHYVDYVALYGVAGFLTDLSTYKHCRQCGVGTRLENRDVDPACGGFEIPFLLRYGWLVALGITSVFVALIILLVYLMQPNRVEFPPKQTNHPQAIPRMVPERSTVRWTVQVTSGPEAQLQLGLTKQPAATGLKLL